MIPRCARPAVVAAALVLTVPAAADGAAVPRLPVTLPGDAAAAGVRADPGSWIVGARGDVAVARIARAHGARPVGPSGAYVVARARAAGLAAALRTRGALAYAEPNLLRRRADAAAGDPLDAESGWRALVLDGAPAPPAVTPDSPLIALVDSALDRTHPEFANSNITTLGNAAITEAHGTETASVAAAPSNGIGLTGLWPDARTLNIPEGGDGITCAASAAGIERAIRAHAAVVNMSYGSPAPRTADLCVPEWGAIEDAIRHGVVPVAASGNGRRAEGNALEYPASLPHVVTVGALAQDAQGRWVPAPFSSSSPYVDLSAPGVGIPTAVPLSMDPSGYTLDAGTSFSAPMVSAAVAWVRAARPGLSADQAAGVVAASARDVGRRGWDPRTGHGVLSVRRALGYAAPAPDPREPNDAPYFVDATIFPAAAPLSRGGAMRLRASVDAAEDPDDFYRVVVPGRTELRAALRPQGAADLTAYVSRPSRHDYVRVAQSRRRGSGTERIALVNRARRREVLFVGVDAAARHRGTIRYRLAVTRP
jgi:hypothetical protein